MITYFYKILYDKTDVVYVGVTTTSVHRRFLKHKSCRKLNDKYSVVEFYRILHPTIDSIERYNEEYKKVYTLERQFIEEEKLKGSKLLNISLGGEWGANILNRIRKKDFFKKYNNYDNYKQYIKTIHLMKSWMYSWIQNRSINKTQRWIQNWYNNRAKNKTKDWI